MSTKWTNDQQRAISTDGKNLLVSAAAGSGKTAVLVERIIRKITDPKHPVDIDRLLIVTFTEAAAGEMRRRIYEAIAKAQEADPENRFIRRQLTLLPRASISTLHSFCQGLLRNYFYKLNISPNFSIGEEAQLALLRDAALDSVLEENEFPHLSVFEGMEGRSAHTLRSILLELYHFTQSLPFPKEWLTNLHTFYQKENFMRFFGKPLVDQLKMDTAELVFRYGEAISFCQKPYGPENMLPVLEEERGFFRALSACCDEGDWNQIRSRLAHAEFARAPRKKKEYDETYTEVIKELRKAAKDLVKNATGKVFYDTLDEVIADNQFSAQTVEDLCQAVLAFLERFSERKAEENLMDFNDLEHFTITLLTNEAEVTDSLRKRFAEVYVDEYQDTNGVQSLIVETVSRGDNLFMVGDVKQSIYRFRNAEPSLFLEKQTAYLQEKLPGETVFLAKNFRSTKGVLDFINHIFERITTPELSDMHYGENERLYYGGNILENTENPSVEVHILEKEVDLEDEELDEDADLVSALEREAHFTAKQILYLVEVEKRKVFDRKTGGFRPVEYRDIAILSRTGKSVAETFSDVLSAYLIPVYTETRGGFLMSVEIITMLAFLQVIDNPLQDIPLLTLLRSPIYRFSDHELTEIRLLCKYGPFYHALKRSDSPKAVGFLNKIMEYRMASRSTTVESLLRHILSDTNYTAIVSLLPDGRTKAANLAYLLQLAAVYEESESKGVFDFLRYIRSYLENGEDFTSQKMISENDNVVKIMTIHKSKGLEFPVVFLVHTSQSFNKSDLRKPLLYDSKMGIATDYIDIERRIKFPTAAKNALAFKKEKELLAEEIRMLYVALTRAISHLYIIGSVKDMEGRFARWTQTEPAPQNLFRQQRLLDLMMLAWKDVENLRCTITFHTANEILLARTQGIRPPEQEPLCPEGFSEELDRSLSYHYPYPLSPMIPAKASVSELIADENEISIPRPHFSVEKTDAAFTGTILHFVMQNLDLSKAGSEEEIQEEIQKMVGEEILRQEYAQLVEVPRLAQFYSSEIGKRLRNAIRVSREVTFFMKMPAADVVDALPEEYQGETVLVQGAVDCFFEETDGIVVLDYKTGRADNPKYQKQLDIYCEGLQKMLSKPIKERRICKI